MTFRIALAAVITLASAAILAPPPAYGDTVDTYTFSEGGWFDLAFNANNVPVFGNPEPNVSLTGSFTGVVEPSGLIATADLSAFQAELLEDGMPPLVMPSTGLTLFSFNTTGGAGSLFTAGNPVFPLGACIGAAATLDPLCNRDFQIAYPAGIRAAVEFFGFPKFISTDAPVVTLQSSVVTTPEPRLFVMTGLLLLAGLSRVWRRRPISHSY